MLSKNLVVVSPCRTLTRVVYPCFGSLLHADQSVVTDDDQWDSRVWGRLTLLLNIVVVYYESIKRELKTKPIYECRWDERLKTRVEESTRLTWTQLVGELEHLKINLSVSGLCCLLWIDKRELKKRLTFECRCDSRLKSKVEGSTLLAYTRWHEEP